MKRVLVITCTCAGSILGLFVFVCLQVQENVFVEFNHQELLEFYNKVC